MMFLHYCLQVLWTFSIYLEAVAILPQLVLLQRTQNIDNLTGNYVFLLGWVVVVCVCMCSVHACTWGYVLCARARVHDARGTLAT